MPPTYAGGLQQKKKSELQEIALALKINDQGTRESIQVRIKEHLDAHQDKLEDNPKFAGLYTRKRKSAADKPSRFVSMAEEADSKPISPRLKDDRHAPALETIDESASATVESPQKAVLSTPAPTPSKLVKVPTKTPDRPLPSPPKTVATPKAQPQNLSQLQLTQANILRNGSEMLFVLRTFLSNSRNIWSLTAIVELLYILSVVIPWKAVYVPLTPKGDLLSLPVLYPPLEVFRTRAFWLVLLHWFTPTLLVPAIVGNLISFTPGANVPQMNVDASPTSHILPFDPLTASIVRLATEIAYPYTLVETRSEVPGLDILGFRWRVLHASIGLAFAFAEAIAGAPQAFAKSFLKEQRQFSKNGETRTSLFARKAIASEETLVQ